MGFNTFRQHYFPKKTFITGPNPECYRVLKKSKCALDIYCLLTVFSDIIRSR